MERNLAHFLIGLGGWEHDILDSCLYPRPGMTSAEKLAFYAESFSLAEIRPTFWDADLSTSDASEWVEAVRGVRDFTFNVKLHRAFTHEQKFGPVLTRNVRGILQELARHNRLGGLLVQFPYGFTNTGANRRHIVRLAEIFRGFPMYVELRHSSWDSSSLPAFLAENAMRSVSADLPKVRQYMPCITWTVGDMAYVRLHGRNEKGWLLNGIDARYDYLYNGRELHELQRRIDVLSQRCRTVMLVCNNTTGGKAVANALQLSHAVRGGKRIAIPPPALRAFPGLSEAALPLEAQGTLFSREGVRTAV